MSHTITAADANREFSAMLRRVKRGHGFVVTSHGRPVARITPISDGERMKDAARSALLARLKAAPVRTLARWTRDELYEER